MAWRFDADMPVSKQIASRIRLDILSGKYLPGQQFPPVRQLAFEAAVNPNTMQKALDILGDEGLLEARGTIGRFVTDDTVILEQMKATLQNEYMQRIINEAQSLGITKEQFIQFLSERNEEL